MISRQHYYKYQGKYYTIDGLAKLSGIPAKTLINRMNRQMYSVERAVETPAGTNNTPWRTQRIVARKESDV